MGVDVVEVDVTAVDGVVGVDGVAAGVWDEQPSPNNATLAKLIPTSDAEMEERIVFRQVYSCRAHS
jgi:hypothetical protein